MKELNERELRQLQAGALDYIKQELGEDIVDFLIDEYVYEIDFVKPSNGYIIEVEIPYSQFNTVNYCSDELEEHLGFINQDVLVKLNNMVTHWHGKRNIDLDTIERGFSRSLELLKENRIWLNISAEDICAHGWE